MEKKWWHKKVAYQIYPKSFKDTNGDGIGDIRGIIEKLDYLKDLGVDIIWICPMYKSPFVDQGYDISDYYKIAPEFGTMEDFDELLAETKKRDMYILMDLVINHCSSEHEWFKKAMEDPDGEYGDYFYIREGKDGNPPNNSRSYFGGSVWEPIPGTNKYYLHCFAKEQPDLNWENPVLREKLYEMVNWWLDKGLAGFRVDAIMNIKKLLDFPDFEPDWPDGSASVTRVIEEAKGIEVFLAELRDKTFKKHNAFTVGEVFGLKRERMEEFIGDDGYFSSIFDFEPYILSKMSKAWSDTSELDFNEWRDTIFKTQKESYGMGLFSNILENHDEPRGNSHYLPKYAQNEDGIKMLSTVNILLYGIPFIFQGQEIGMRNIVMDSIEEYDDIETKGRYKEMMDLGLSKKEAMAACVRNSRDNGRTPIQWDATENAGFTTGKPWMKVNPNYKIINVEKQQSDDGSVLNYYKKLIALRKDERYVDVFTYGETIPMYLDKEKIMSYYRILGDERILVAANFGQENQLLELDCEEVDVIFNNMSEVEIEKQAIILEPSQVIVIK